MYPSLQKKTQTGNFGGASSLLRYSMVLVEVADGVGRTAKYINCCMLQRLRAIKKLVGGFNPSEKYEFVSWDDYSQYMGSHKIHVPNHQPENQYPLEFLFNAKP